MQCSVDTTVGWVHVQYHAYSCSVSCIFMFSIMHIHVQYHAYLVVVVKQSGAPVLLALCFWSCLITDGFRLQNFYSWFSSIVKNLLFSAVEWPLLWIVIYKLRNISDSDPMSLSLDLRICLIAGFYLLLQWLLSVLTMQYSFVMTKTLTIILTIVLLEIMLKTIGSILYAA